MAFRRETVRVVTWPEAVPGLTPPGPDTQKIGSADRVQSITPVTCMLLGYEQRFPPALGPTETLNASICFSALPRKRLIRTPAMS